MHTRLLYLVQLRSNVTFKDEKALERQCQYTALFNGLSHSFFFLVGYDSSVNPSIANSFATAAYRFGHSLLVGTFKRYDKRFNNLQDLKLSEVSELKTKLHFHEPANILLSMFSFLTCPSKLHCKVHKRFYQLFHLLLSNISK